MTRVGSEFEDGLLLIGDKAIPNRRRCLAVEDVPRVGHGKVFAAVGVRKYPSHHVDDLTAMEVNDTKGGAALDLEGVPMPAGYDMLLPMRAVGDICCSWLRGRLEILDLYLCHAARPDSRFSGRGFWGSTRERPLAMITQLRVHPKPRYGYA